MTDARFPPRAGLRTAVLVSGSGTLLQALLDARAGAAPAGDPAGDPAQGDPAQGDPAQGDPAQGDPAQGAAFRVCAVLSDRAGAQGLQRARAAGVPTAVVAPADFPDRRGWDDALAAAVDVFSPDLLVLAGFMRLVGEPLLSRYAGRILNTHPALLPAFPGAHGVRDALAHGVKVSGCSVILVDAGVDTGPIVAQEAVPVAHDDDEATLHERIKVVERRLLVDVVARMARHGWTVHDRKVTLA